MLSLADLKERFYALKERFQEEGMDVHSKGKFEWVDGILVKSLMEGWWLLIENVNFCRFVSFDLLYLCQFISIVVFGLVLTSLKCCLELTIWIYPYC